MILVFEQIYNLQKETISMNELQCLLMEMGLNTIQSQSKTKQLFDILDPTQSGHIQLTQPIHYNSNKTHECKYSPLNTNHNVQIVFINNHSTIHDDSSLSELR